MNLIYLTFDHLERIADSAEPTSPKAAGRGYRPRSATAPADQNKTANWEAIYQGCDALRSWADTAVGLPEPSWYALASVVGRCAQGDEIFHDLSERDGRYDAAETDGKLAHALEASPPRLCSSIEELGGDCDQCPFKGRINSPIALGYGADPRLVKLARRWVYVAGQDAFVDLQKLEDCV